MAESNVPKFEDTEPVFDETSPVDEPSFDDTMPVEDVSKTESFLRGAAQGGTLGFADELVGASKSTLDDILSLIGQGNTSVPKAKYDEFGRVSNVDELNANTTYEKNRDAYRQADKAAQEANPLTFLGGNVAGGFAAPIPGALAAPLGAAAKGANLGARMLKGATNAVPTGVLAGAGMSEANDLSGLGEDVLQGGALAGAFGGMIPAAGAALGAGKDVAGKLIPQTAKDAYQRGKEGINVAGKEFYDATTGKLRDVVDDVSGVISGKVKGQQAANADEIAKLDNQILNVEKDIKSAVARGEQRAMAESAKDIADQTKKELATAEKVQGRIAQVRKRLGTNYERIDKAAEKLGIAPENRDVINNLFETLDLASLPDSSKEALKKKIVPYLGKQDKASHQGLKDQLVKLFDSSDRQVSQAAKKAYADLRNNYMQQFVDNGYEGLANKLADTNKRWAKALQLEDEFFSNVRKVGDLAATDTISTMGKFASKNAKQASEANAAAKLLTEFDPKQAPNLIRQMSNVADEGLALKGAQEAVPVLPNPELAKYEALLAQAKGQTKAASEIPGLPLNVSDETALKNQLTNLLPKQGQQTGQNVAENQLGDLFNFLGKEKGSDFVNQTQSKLSEVNKDLNIRNAVNRNADLDITKGGIINKVADVVTGGATSVANKAGLVANKGQALLQNGVKTLSEASPEALKSIAQKFSTQGKQGAEYASVLAQAAEKNSRSRNAIIFGLMQQPNFREMFRQVETENNE